MTIWFVLALMTVAAMFAVLWPLSRRAPARAGSDVEVYRDQLEEIERDRAAGRIEPGEAEAARVEVSRRLIAAADAAPVAIPDNLKRRRAVALAALILLPVGAGALYLALGSPLLPDQPQMARRDVLPEQRSIEELVARVEAHLEQNPNDGRGWEVVAPVYLRLNRLDDAVRARRNALRLLGATAEREADLGEALTFVANGMVTAEAKETFDRALKIDPQAFKARYFLGLAAEQDGRRDDAAKIWRGLIEGAPPGVPWLSFVRESLARVDPSATPPGPNAADVAAASEMAPEQRNEMVRGMVARLAERLKQEGTDVDGWSRLLRAYMVLGEPDKARAAAGDARRALAGEPDKVRQIDELIKGLGLEG
ncbi:MAG: c-type cytochrome biogenesis protein CcmI [Pseudomonadota bacterium]